jgi:isopentenyldiphosphate isomerase
MTIKEVKKELGITDNDLAEFFQYKTDMAYRNSSARSRIENGIVKLYALMKTRAGQKKPA